MGLVVINGFTAAVLGGFGSMPGAVVGGMLLGVLENLAPLYLPVAHPLLRAVPASSSRSCSCGRRGCSGGWSSGRCEARAALAALGALLVGVAVAGAALLRLPGQPDRSSTRWWRSASISCRGYTNQLSFGHAGFLAIGAYTAALLTIHAPALPVPLTLAAAGLVTAAVGLAFGVPCLRLSGLYLAMATLAFGFVITEAILNLDCAHPRRRRAARAGGAAGRLAPGHRHRALLPGGWPWRRSWSRRRANLARTRTGRALLAIRESEIAAQASGVPVAALQDDRLRRSRRSTPAWRAGSSPSSSGFLSPDAFDVFLSVDFVVMIIVGGLGSVPGSVVGAAVVTMLHDSAGRPSRTTGRSSSASSSSPACCSCRAASPASARGWRAR